MNKKEVIIEYGKNENLTQVEFNSDKKKNFIQEENKILILNQEKMK